ncbi:nuclear transport factor 2 family protein [Polaribacter sp.]|jgi:hypothetical protein|uniref:nuclear transport factor 2 family protein n=1 Tax=Polaribacter sp. TaxID=1920175 RepID=UPI004048AA91
MRNVIAISAVFFLLISCEKPISEISTTEKHQLKLTLNTFLDDWHLAASEANYANYFNKMDSISIFLGTDATENWTKKQFEEYSKPHFDKGKAWNFKSLERNIYLNNFGNFAWFDEHLKTNRGTFRGSGILENIKNNWKIKHYVLSVPIPNDNMNEIVKITRKNDSIFQSKFN